MEIVLFLTAVFVYLNGLFSEFVFDDIFAIVDNADVVEGSQLLLTSDALWKHDFWGQDIKSTTSHKSYRPFTILSFRLMRIFAQKLTGSSDLKAHWFRGLNIVLHGLNTVFVYKLASCLIELRTASDSFNAKEEEGQTSKDHQIKTSQIKRHGLRQRRNQTKTIKDKTVVSQTNSSDVKTDKLEALFAGALFAVHPIHTEAVTGVVGQAELLSAFFSLIALCLYLKTYKTSVPTPVIMVLVFLSTLCKEIGITTIGSLCLLELFLPRRKATPSIFKILCFLSVFVLYLEVRVWIADDHLVRIYGKVENPVAFADTITTKIMTLFYYHTKYASLLLLPIQLSADWSYACIPYVHTIFDLRNLLTLALWLYMASIGINSKPWQLFKNEKVLSEQRWRFLCLTSLMICPFLPSSNLFFYVGTAIGERLLYFPSIGFCLLLAQGITNSKLLPSARKKKSFAFVLFLILTICTYKRNLDWKNEHSLFESALRVCPESAKVQLNNGILSRRLGDFNQALLHFNKARNIESSFCITHYWTGLTFIDQGNLEEGLFYLKEALNCEESTAKALKALRRIHEVFWKRTNTSEDVRLLEWSEILLHPSQSMVLDGCATVEQSAITAKAFKHNSLFPRIQQKTSECVRRVQELSEDHGKEGALYEVFGRCMETRMDLILSNVEDGIESRRIGLYLYLHDLGDQCRQNSALLSGRLNAHASFINSFQLEDPDDPWLQLEWAKILEVQGRPLEASTHFNAAAFLFLNCIEVAKQTPKKGAQIYNIQSTSEDSIEVSRSTELPKGIHKAKQIANKELKRRTFDLLRSSQCKSLVIECFKRAFSANPSLAPQITQWISSIENLDPID